MHEIAPKGAGVYKIVNATNGKTYVGSSGNIYRRWGEHRRKLRAGTSSSWRLQAAWTKYGAQAFTFSVLELCSSSVVAAREQAWIDAIQPAYNVAPAAGSQAGVKRRPETCALIASVTRITPEQRAKMVAGIRSMSPEAKLECSRRQSAAHMGNTYNLGRRSTPEANAKRSAALKGRVFSEEHRAKLSEANRRRGAAA